MSFADLDLGKIDPDVAALVSCAAQSPAAQRGLQSLLALAAGKTPTRSRQTRLAAVEATSKTARDASAEALLTDFSRTSGDRRALAAEQWRQLYIQAERIAHRRERLRRYRRVYLAALSVNAAAVQIKRDIERRSGNNVRSLGDASKDQLIDAIIITTPHIALKTIRVDLST